MKKYGRARHGFIRFQCILDLTKVEPSDANEEQQVKDFLQAMPDQKIILVPLGGWCTDCCDPDGCYC